MASAQFFATQSTPGSFGVTGRCLHVSVTKFQDKFTSLRQVNSPNSWEKFQICCTDMYLIRFLPNFAVFCVFLWISRLCDGAKYQKPWLWAASFTLYKLATKNLHLATIFSSWSPKGDQRIFLISSPVNINGLVYLNALYGPFSFSQYNISRAYLAIFHI